MWYLCEKCHGKVNSGERDKNDFVVVPRDIAGYVSVKLRIAGTGKRPVPICLKCLLKATVKSYLRTAMESDKALTIPQAADLEVAKEKCDMAVDALFAGDPTMELPKYAPAIGGVDGTDSSDQ